MWVRPQRTGTHQCRGTTRTGRSILLTVATICRGLLSSRTPLDRTRSWLVDSLQPSSLRQLGIAANTVYDHQPRAASERQVRALLGNLGNGRRGRDAGACAAWGAGRLTPPGAGPVCCADVANPEHLKILKRGVAAWHEWRAARPDLAPDLIGANLTKAQLRGTSFSGANLTGAACVNTRPLGRSRRPNC